MDENHTEILKLDEVNAALINKFKKAGLENILLCIQCGTCSASCPSGRFTAFKTRKLIRKAILGLDNIFEKEDLWLCTTCHTCVERCPRKIEIVPLIIGLRNIAADLGIIHPNHKKIAHTFILTGHAVPINEENKMKRKSLGLSEVPPTVHASEKAQLEVQSICKKMGFDKKVNLSWE